jgi:hypothetical protein
MCKNHKTLESFSFDKSRKDGLSWRCKTCHTEINKKYYEANNARYRAAHPPKPKKPKSQPKIYPRNPEKANESSRKSRAKYPEKRRELVRKRRALKKSLPHERFYEKDVLARWGTNCHICNEPIDFDAPRRTGWAGWERGLQLDHVIPIKKGGPDTLENVKPAHGICNLRKHAN